MARREEPLFNTLNTKTTLVGIELKMNALRQTKSLITYLRETLRYTMN